MRRIFLTLTCTCVALLLKAQQETITHPVAVPMKFVGITQSLLDASETPPGDLSLPNVQRIDHDQDGRDGISKEDESVDVPVTDDPVLQRDYSNAESLTSASVLSSWAGLSANVDPSDNTIAVGPNHVMQMTNNSTSTYIKIWNKSGTVLVNNKLVSTITNHNDYGDCDVMYDPVADRFVFVVLYSFSASKLIVCVSQTSDPTGAWYHYTVSTTGGFPDYPKIGMWGNSYFITTNSNAPSVFALNRSKMLSGHSPGAALKFSLTSLPSINFETPSFVTQTGSTAPPSGSPGILMRVEDDAWGSSIGTDKIELYKLTIDWVTTTNSTMTGPTNLSIASYSSNLCGFNSGNCVPEPGTNSKLDPLNHVLMDKMQYIRIGNRESIVCTHVCNSSNVSAVRWYELRKNNSGNWTVYQQGTYQPDNNWRFMPAISINNVGSIALGYNISSGNVYPGVRLTGRDSCDALNSMTASETTGQSGSSRNGSSRYGDYNGLVADPSDGSFWLTGNYNASTNWSTRVIHFTISNCPLMHNSNTSSIQYLTLVPNPASTEVAVNFESAGDQTIPLQVIDMSGKVLLQQIQNVTMGLNKTTLDVSSLVSGFYIVKLPTDVGDVIQKLVIQR